MSEASNNRQLFVDRAYRAGFLGLLCFGLITGYVTKPAMNAEMRSFLRGSEIRDVEKIQPEIELPMLHWGGRVLSVVHETSLPGTDASWVLRSYFEPDGTHLATQTLRLPVTGRKPVGEVEAEMLALGETFLEPTDNAARRFEFRTVLGQIAERIDATRISGLILFPATYVQSATLGQRGASAATDDAAPDSTYRSYVLNIWCTPDDPAADQATFCPPAARIIYDTETSSVITMDQLL